MKIIIWNTEWAKPGSKKERIIQEVVSSHAPDIICITEGYAQTWKSFDNVITSEQDYGYEVIDGRHKVMLVSTDSWRGVDTIGNDQLPSGRFVSGITHGIEVIGVCIPWRMAHVTGGIKVAKYGKIMNDILKGLRAS